VFTGDYTFCLGIKLNKIKIGSAITRAINEHCTNNGHTTEQLVLRELMILLRTGRRGGRRKQLVDDLKEVIDFILWRTRFGIGSGPVIRHCVIVVVVVVREVVVVVVMVMMMMTMTTMMMMTTTKTTICCFTSNEGRIRKTVDFKILFRHRSENIEEILEPAVTIQDSPNTLSFASLLCPSHKVKMVHSRKCSSVSWEICRLATQIISCFCSACRKTANKLQGK